MVEMSELKELGLRVVPLDWPETYFVVHASGHFSFFMSEYEAESYAYTLDRGHYTYNDRELSRYGERLKSAKEEWEREEKSANINAVLSRLERVK